MTGAANDAREWTGDDDWFVCACGCHDFLIRRDAKTDWIHLLCKKCETDHTMRLSPKRGPIE